LLKPICFATVELEPCCCCPRPEEDDDAPPTCCQDPDLAGAPSPASLGAGGCQKQLVEAHQAIVDRQAGEDEPTSGHALTATDTLVNVEVMPAPTVMTIWSHQRTPPLDLQLVLQHFVI
jgi:hypothetical protein